MAHGEITGLVQSLKSSPGSSTAVQAAGALKTLAYENLENRDAIAEAGAIPALVQLILGSASGKPATIQEGQLQATQALSNLTYENNKNCDAIREAGAIPALVHLIANPNQQAAASQGYFSGLVGASPSSLHKQVIEQATVALGNLAYPSPTNRDAVREAGGIPALLNLLGEVPGPGKSLTTYSTSALSNLIFENDKNREAVRAAAGIPALARLLRAGPHEMVTLYATTALGNAVQGNPANCIAVREAEAIPQIVRLLAVWTKGQKQLAGQAASVVLELVSHSAENCAAVREAGAVVHLVEMLRVGANSRVAQASMKIIGHLAAESSSEQQRAMWQEGTVRPLLDMAFPIEVITLPTARRSTRVQAVGGEAADVLAMLGYTDAIMDAQRAIRAWLLHKRRSGSPGEDRR
ncbi:hypothetical protein CYMTET_22046 [Cymbomonas tetramitiformis]|uniref:Uncharacterized protein n=1 Tax=Cymbomonas tetramitiformis TaxID=36881 RepID=A0AAE0G1C2_9CHLO|nr:hypothetical protein CYMTET_22046 [Cymbomonas tetramitiformis]